MHGGAISLAKKFNNFIQDDKIPDIILTTDMLNLPVFTAFANVKSIPIITFFHENQLTYPWSTQDRDKVKNRDHHYGFINYTTALKSDLIMYNSNFHKDSFINALQIFLKQFPDHNELSSINCIEKKSVVSHLGLTLQKFDNYKTIQNNKIPIILWNHRWEYDKNPDLFFNTLFELDNNNIDFKLIVVGESYSEYPNIFNIAKNRLGSKIIHFGYCDNYQKYIKYLKLANILPVTSNQDFFGISIVEAVAYGAYPILPNRLSYPELFDKSINPHIFYKNKTEFKDKIMSAINNVNLISDKIKPLRNNVYDNFNWNNVSKKYDKTFNELNNNDV